MKKKTVPLWVLAELPKIDGICIMAYHFKIISYTINSAPDRRNHLHFILILLHLCSEAIHWKRLLKDMSVHCKRQDEVKHYELALWAKRGKYQKGLATPPFCFRTELFLPLAKVAKVELSSNF